MKAIVCNTCPQEVEQETGEQIKDGTEVDLDSFDVDETTQKQSQKFVCGPIVQSAFGGWAKGGQER